MERYLDRKQQDTGDAWVLPSLGEEEHKPQPQKNAGQSSVCASLQTVGAGKGACIFPIAFLHGLFPLLAVLLAVVQADMFRRAISRERDGIVAGGLLQNIPTEAVE